MNFTVLTIFPEMLEPFWAHGIVRRAIEAKTITASALNIRDYADGRHRVTDDRPFGGGTGMVMKPEPLAKAIQAAKRKTPASKTLLLTPQGRPFDHQLARQYAEQPGLILVCGRYEGVDERIVSAWVDEEVSIGDFVLSGGELAAMIVIEAVTRLLPGALGGEGAAQKDTFSDGLMEHAQYTRPREFEGHTVPDILLSGNHKAIDQWRQKDALIRTFLKRPELLKQKRLSPEEIEVLKQWCREIEDIINTQSARGVDPLPGGQ